jgi:type IV pilus biogenesis protein PilP
MDNKFYRGHLLFFGLLLITHTTYAEPKTIGDLAEIQSETVIYRAKKERAKALSELNSMTGISGETTHSSSHWPVIRTVQGKKPDLQAILRYPDGSEITVKSGDQLPNGMIMGSITVKEITLVNPSISKEIRLGFSSIAPPLASSREGSSH